MTSPIGRRQFLAGSLAAAAISLAGCGSPRRSEPSLGASDAVNIINWEQYIDPQLIGDIGSVAEMSVNYLEEWSDNYSGWDRIRGSLESGSTPEFDIAVPTNWLAAQMVAQGYVEEIPLEIVPNHVNLDPAYMVSDWDRGARFHLPWQAGITGIAYNPDLTKRPITSVSDLFNETFSGRVGMIGEMREAVGLAMLAQGLDPSQATPDTARQGLDLLTEASGRGQFVGWYYEDFEDALTSQEVAITMAWSGNAIGLLERNPNLRFVIPDEGAIRWFDTMVILKNSPAIAAAGKWMNNVYDPLFAAQITNYVGYISPVLGVQDTLDNLGGAAADMARNPLMFPDPETSARLYTWGGLDVDTDNELDEEFSKALLTPFEE